jgi:hypothetical protein
LKFLLLSAGAWLATFFWGAGLSWLALPARLRRHWPLVALTAGLTLQATVVWLAAWAGAQGTGRYAVLSLAVPGILGMIAVGRAGPARFLGDLRECLSPLAVSAGVLGLLILPYAVGYHGLTTGSLGSCDAADYAGGARCFMEFSRMDRMGFMGLTEVTHVASVDTFFDFYLKLMHFGPCAIVAMDATLFGCAPHEIIAVLCCLFLSTAVPIVFLIASDHLELRHGLSVGIALLFGLSPVNWYAVHQTAMAQLLAAQGIGLLTWAACGLWQWPEGSRQPLRLVPILLVAFSLIMASYTFIAVVCLVPAFAFAGGWALWTRQYRRFWRWMLWIHAAFAVSALLYLPRTASIIERFVLFKRYDEGWKIPFLWPEGWLGVVRGPFLHPLPEPWHSLAIGLLVSALAATLYGLRALSRPLLFHVACLTVPSLAGCIYLAVQGVAFGHGENRSYLAYKLFCVFYPGILPSLCTWGLMAYQRGAARVFFWVLLAGLAFGVGRVDWETARIMVTPPRLVDRELVELSAIESDPRVASLNLMNADMWSRLWTNCFLLRKAHYFPTHTYEGRLNTPLRGEWDLNGGLIEVKLPPSETITVNPSFTLADTRSPLFVRAELDEGWHEPEHLVRRPIHWIWSRGNASVKLTNPHDHPVRATLEFHLRSRSFRDIQFWIEGECHLRQELTPKMDAYVLRGVLLRPGKTLVDLRSSTPVDLPQPEDTRPLGFALSRLEVTVEPAGR